MGVDPKYLGIGPVPAVTKLMKRTNISMEAIDTLELNEAFSSQVIACQDELNIPIAKLNRWGGAIASGHPYGASGAALVARLFHMKSYYRSIATMGIGEAWVMQYYLKDGEERRTVTFHESDVQKYCLLFNIEFNGHVPTLMCAKLWPEFEIYKSFVKETLILKETYIKEINKLVTNEDYSAILRKISENNQKYCQV